MTVRRLHDRGRSARWLLPHAVTAAVWRLIVFWTLDTLFGPDGPRGWGALGFILVVILLSVIWVLVTLVWSIVLLTLCSLPGTRIPNRYGPDPGLTAP